MHILNPIDDLRLHEDVERAHGLVRDDELRFRRGAREADALSLATENSLRVTVGQAWRRPDALEQPHDALTQNERETLCRSTATASRRPL